MKTSLASVQRWSFSLFPPDGDIVLVSVCMSVVCTSGEFSGIFFQITHGRNSIQFVMLMSWFSSEWSRFLSRSVYFPNFWLNFHLMKWATFRVCRHLKEWSALWHADVSWPPSDLYRFWSWFVDFPNFSEMVQTLGFWTFFCVYSHHLDSDWKEGLEIQMFFNQKVQVSVKGEQRHILNTLHWVLARFSVTLGLSLGTCLCYVVNSGITFICWFCCVICLNNFL